MHHVSDSHCHPPHVTMMGARQIGIVQSILVNQRQLKSIYLSPSLTPPPPHTHTSHTAPHKHLMPPPHPPVTMMGTRRMVSFSLHPAPMLTLLGSSQMFIRVPITIWLFTVHCGRSKQAAAAAAAGAAAAAAAGATGQALCCNHIDKEQGMASESEGFCHCAEHACAGQGQFTTSGPVKHMHSALPRTNAPTTPTCSSPQAGPPSYA
jgi:hypothetical protein